MSTEDVSNNTALVTMPEDMPQLPNLQGKVGGASVKAKEEQSSVAEIHKTVSTADSIIIVWTTWTNRTV